MCARVFVCVCASLCVRAIYVRACMGACLQVCSVSVYVCVYVGVCACVCVPVSVCLFLVIVMPNGRVTVGSQSGLQSGLSRVLQKPSISLICIIKGYYDFSLINL